MTNSKGSQKKIKSIVIASSVAVVALAGAGVATAHAYNTETVNLCQKAVKHATTVQKDVDAALSKADEALASVEVTTLPNGVGESTKYADRQATEAVESTDESGATVQTVAARQSGADYITDVTKVYSNVEGVKLSNKCDSRQAAAEISKKADIVKAEVETLAENTETLTADFTAFQEQETERVVAEAAAAEAARVEAERVAAEQAAAEQAAAEQAAAEQAAIAQYGAYDPNGLYYGYGSSVGDFQYLTSGVRPDGIGYHIQQDSAGNQIVGMWMTPERNAQIAAEKGIDLNSGYVRHSI